MGRSDVLIRFKKHAIILEFKFARKSSDIAKLRKEGMKQIEAKRYAEPFEIDQGTVTATVIVIDGINRKAVL